MLGAGLNTVGGGADLLWLSAGPVCTQSTPDVSHVECVKVSSLISTYTESLQKPSFSNDATGFSYSRMLTCFILNCPWLCISLAISQPHVSFIFTCRSRCPL